MGDGYIVGSVDSVRHGTPSERKDSFQRKAYAPKMATPVHPCAVDCPVTSAMEQTAIDNETGVDFTSG